MILAILQARVSSSRLPGKVLLPLLGEPMLFRQIERLKRATQIDRLIVATSTDASDNLIENLCRERQISCFRGSLDDVLDRFYQAARQFEPDHIVRLTGDCPLADPGLIDRMISFYLDGGYDYVSTAIEPTFPDGLDAEVFSFRCLEEVWTTARLPSQREHVTLSIYQQPERFLIGSYKNDTDLSHLRWTVDEQVDLDLVTEIYGTLYPAKSDFTTNDILHLLEQKPWLKTLNTHYERNEGLQKSFSKDHQYQHIQEEE